MFKQLFATMNEVLDDIIAQYPLANSSKRRELEDQLSVLKDMSDTCIEEWLLFDEKMGRISQNETESGAVALPDSEPCMPDIKEKAKTSGSFDKGQGYYKLGMFDEAAGEFELLVSRRPDDLLPRIYLAMSYLRMGQFGDAYRHFQFLVPLTENRKIKAISYNAMGCIHAENNNLDQAIKYFKKAHTADPSCIEPVLNMKHWSSRT